MDSQYPQAQPMGQSPFFYYTPDPKADNRHHGHFSQQPNHVQIPMYNPYMQQSMPSTPIYSRPNSSGSQAPMPSHLYHTGYPSDMTPMVSPRPLYQRPTILIDHPPKLTIESNACEADIYYYPATPPLSASASSISSPSSAGVSPIQVNPAFYAFEGVKEGCAGEVQSENLAGGDWARCGSPTMTPVFIQPTSLMSSGANELLSAASCPSLSPSPSPFQQSQEQGQDSFCDPRNLTVANGSSSTQSSLKPVADFPALPTLCAGDEEEHKFILGGEAFSKSTGAHTFDFSLPEGAHGLPTFDQFSDLDSEDDFVNGLVNFPPTENVQFFGSKRQRTGAELVAVEAEPFASEDDFEDFDDSEQFAVACLPSPPASITESEIKKEKRAKRSKKARSDEDSSKFDNLVRSRKYTMNGEDAAAIDDAQDMEHTTPSHAGSDTTVNHSGETPSEADGTPSQAPVNRRGRKQSLTEDPSKTFVCDQCNRRFRRQEHLKRHYRSLHTHDKPFECHECGKKFSRSDNLSQHARTHGSGAIVMGVLEDGELPADGEGDHIRSLGNVLFHVAAAASGSDTDSASTRSGDSQGRKKRKRSE